MTLRRQLPRAWTLFSAHGFFLGSGIAFEALLSLVPLIVITLLAGRHLIDTELTRDGAVQGVLGLLGPRVSAALAVLLESAEKLSTTELSLPTLALLLYAGSRVFRAVQSALSIMWELEPKPVGEPWYRSMLRSLRSQVPALLLVPVVGVLLVALFIAQAVLNAAGDFLGARELPLELGTIALTLLALSGLFALVYKALPPVKVLAPDALFGGVATAVLVSIGTTVAGAYVARMSTAGLFGLSTTAVTLMLWVLYSSQVFLFGAALTRARADDRAATGARTS